MRTIITIIIIIEIAIAIVIIVIINIIITITISIIVIIITTYYYCYVAGENAIYIYIHMACLMYLFVFRCVQMNFNECQMISLDPNGSVHRLNRSTVSWGCWSDTTFAGDFIDDGYEDGCGISSGSGGKMA